MPPEAAQSPAAPKSYVEYPKGKIIIELGDAKCRKIFFQPTAEAHRGKWDSAIMKGNTAVNFPDLAQMPDIPGLQVMIDCQAKLGRIHDPLRDDPKLLAEVTARYKAIRRQDGKPEDDKEYKLDECQMKSWLWYMRGLVDSGSAVMHERSAELPDQDTIRKMRGKIDIGGTESGRRWLEDHEEAIAAGRLPPGYM